MDDAVNEDVDKEIERQRKRGIPKLQIQPIEKSPSANLEKASKRMGKWYVDYILSDFTAGAFATAILHVIKAYFNLNWAQFWNDMVLFYVIFISIMVSRLVKTFCDRQVIEVKR